MPGRRHVVALVAATACVLVVTACGERDEPTGPAAELFPITLTSADDRELTLPAPVRRIALLDPAAQAMVAAFDVEMALPVERDGSIQEGVLRRFRPDLVVATHAIDVRDLSRAAKITGAAVYVLGDSSVRDVERSLSHLGAMVAEPTTARTHVARIERSRRAVARAVSKLPLTSAFVDLGAFTTAPDRTLIGDLLRIAGAENIAADIPDGGPFDLAELRRLDPEVYIAADGHTTAESLRTDKHTRTLTAARTGRVLVLDPAELAPGPQIGRTLERLAAELHPDAAR